VTLTLPVLNNGKNVIFMASGKEKAAVLKAVIEDGNSVLPASLVKPRGDLHFLADLEAGSLMCTSK
jgi:6-phosphogluconolactonase